MYLLARLLLTSLVTAVFSITTAFAGEPAKQTKPAVATAKKAEATPTPGVKKIENDGDKSDTKVKQPKLKKPDELKK